MLFVIFMRHSVRYLRYYVMDVPYIYCNACLECIYVFFLWWWMWLIHKNRKNIKKRQAFAECFYPDTRQSNHFSISWKTYLPSVITLALGEVSNFAECQKTGTRQRPKLRRVPDSWHSAKTQTSPSAARLALGEVWIFAECRAYGTRQSFRPVPFASSPSRSPVQLSVRPSRFNFFCRVRFGTRQRFAECPRKGTRQSRLRR